MSDQGAADAQNPTQVERSRQGRTRCTAHRKSGEPCRNWSEPDYTVCKYHGAGGGAPLTHGRRSKHLPKRLGEAIEAARADPDIMRLDEDIFLSTGLLDVTLEEYAAWIDGGEEPEWWAEFDLAQKYNDRTANPLSLDEVFRQRIRDAIKLRTDAVTGQAKIEAQRNMVLNMRQAEALVRYLCSEVVRIVSNPDEVQDVLASVARYLQGIVYRPDSVRYLPSGSTRVQGKWDGTEEDAA